MQLESGKLYQVSKLTNSSRGAVVLHATGATNISYGFYSSSETLPTTLAELVSKFPADTTINNTTSVTNYIESIQYIGYTGAGSVFIEGITLVEVGA